MDQATPPALPTSAVPPPSDPPTQPSTSTPPPPPPTPRFPYKHPRHHQTSLLFFTLASVCFPALSAAYALNLAQPKLHPGLLLSTPLINSLLCHVILFAHVSKLTWYQRHYILVDSLFLYCSALGMACLYFCRPPGSFIPDTFYMALLHANSGSLLGHPLVASLMGNTLLVPTYVALDWVLHTGSLLQWLPRGLAMCVMLQVSVFAVKMVIGLESQEEAGLLLLGPRHAQRLPQPQQQGQEQQQEEQGPQGRQIQLPRPPPPLLQQQQEQQQQVQARGLFGLCARAVDDAVVQVLSFYLHLQLQARYAQSWIFADCSRFIMVFCTLVVTYQTATLCVKEAIYGSNSPEVNVKPSFLVIGIIASWVLGYLGRPNPRRQS